MGLKEKLQTDLTDAIRARDEVKSGTIRMLLAAITNEEVAGKAAKVLADAEVITVLSREAKKRREAVEAYTQAKRDDLANKEKAEAAVIAASNMRIVPLLTSSRARIASVKSVCSFSFSPIAVSSHAYGI